MRWFSNYFIHVWLLILNVVRLLQLSLRVVKLIFTWCVLIDLLPELMWHLWTVVDAKTRSRKHPPRFKWPSIFWSINHLNDILKHFSQSFIWGNSLRKIKISQSNFLSLEEVELFCYFLTSRINSRLLMRNASQTKVKSLAAVTHWTLWMKILFLSWLGDALIKSSARLLRRWRRPTGWLKLFFSLIRTVWPNKSIGKCQHFHH